MENNYLIPANANRGKLIMGFFRGIDLAIFGSGAGITLLGLLIFQNALSNVAIAITVLLPVLVTGFLVIPVPHQHNVLVFLTNFYKFYFVNQKTFKWKGWCNEYGEEDNKQQ
ncbi:MAG: hypothetical protein IJN90_03065 [Bacilli bacterium]|nr:hypothetical protein [Bacilli bacterium]